MRATIAIVALCVAAAGVSVAGAALLALAREMRARRTDEAFRRHDDLLAAAIADPELAACWGPLIPDDDPERARTHLRINRVLSFHEHRLATGTATPAQLRPVLDTLLGTRAGQEFWARTREHRAAIAAEGHCAARAFHRLAEQAAERGAAVVQGGDRA